MKKFIEGSRTASTLAIHGQGAVEAVEKLNLASVSAGLEHYLVFTAGHSDALWQAWLDASVPVHAQPGSSIIFNLQDPGLVVASANIHGELHWVCRRDPRGLLGGLWDGMQGAYLSSSHGEIILAGNHQLLILAFKPLLGGQDQTLYELCTLLFAHAAAVQGLAYGQLEAGLQALWQAFQVPVFQSAI